MTSDADLPAQLAPLVDHLDGDARQARLALLNDLLASGHSVDDLRRADDNDQLALLPVTDVLRDDGGRSLVEVAGRCGVDAEQLRRVRRAAGLAVSDEAVYGTNLERYAAQLRLSLDAGVDLDSLIAFNYAAGAAAASVASAARDAMRVLLGDVDPNGTEHSRAVRAAELAKLLLPTLDEVVSTVMEEHVRQLARREVTESLTGGPVGPLTDVTIGFADLVGFTAFGDAVTTQELSAVAVALEHATRESLTGGAELVKALGDGVMVCAASTEDAVMSFRALADAATLRDLPPLRIGLAHGPALSRAGDWYGSVVNRASRLSALASPGHILADTEVHDRVSATPDSWRDEGDVAVRGMSAPVRCWSLRAVSRQSGSS